MVPFSDPLFLMRAHFLVWSIVALHAAISPYVLHYGTAREILLTLWCRTSDDRATKPSSRAGFVFLSLGYRLSSLLFSVTKDLISHQTDQTNKDLIIRLFHFEGHISTCYRRVHMLPKSRSHEQNTNALICATVPELGPIYHLPSHQGRNMLKSLPYED